ncbi:WD40-repeat-containing domain protein [Fennellomyces sp. T-0311]|nr:WD40-repeat-containing domain protein [Fennellomyces sp. T-0311]
MAQDNVPNPLDFGKTIFDFTLHPNRDLVATGLINGKVLCHQYGIDQHDELWTERPFKKSCRGVEFTQDGAGIYSISKDRLICLLDTETGKVIHTKENAHENPLNALLCLNENMLATGDDQGVIKLWDNRKADPVMVYTEHEDFIADMTFRAGKKTLVAVGGDGYLSTWDIRKPNVAAMSDNMEDELLSIALVKNGSKAIVGSQEGVLSLWSWGDWGDYNDRIMGHPNSIDTICKLDEDTICTGSSDGIIRIVSVLPNQFHGVIGDHGEDMPIEHIRLCHDKKYLLSSGHDSALRFWDVAYLFEEDEEGEEEENGRDDEKEDVVREQPQVVDGNQEEDDSDQDDEENDEDEDDSDSEEEQKEKPAKKKRKKEDVKKNKKAAFFADL